jgi:hypothetical protein
MKLSKKNLDDMADRLFGGVKEREKDNRTSETKFSGRISEEEKPMKTYYKLTDQKLQTFKGFQWKLGEWQEAKGDIKQSLCTDGWLHCYDSALLAVLHNPIHASIKNPRLFEAEVAGKMKNDKGSGVFVKCDYLKKSRCQK